MFKLMSTEEIETIAYQNQLAVYVLNHMKTGKMYIGATNNPRATINKQYYRLKNNKHHNRQLQDTYNDCDDIRFICYSADTEGQAKELLDSLRRCVLSAGLSFNGVVNIGGSDVVKDGDDTVMDDLQQVLSTSVKKEEEIASRRKPVEKFPDIVNSVIPEGFEDLYKLERLGEEVNVKSTLQSVYLISSPSSGKVYIGSTSNTYNRVIQHRTKLTASYHGNQQLQSVYDANPYLEYICFKVKEGQDPLDLEQELLDRYWSTGRLLNSSPDARNALRAFVYKGMKFSKERIANMKRSRKDSGAGATPRKVIVNGITYPSVRSAARETQTPYSVLQRRLNSDEEQYKDWYYTT